MSTQAVREYLALVWEQYKLANRNMRSMLTQVNVSKRGANRAGLEVLISTAKGCQRLGQGKINNKINIS